MSVPKWRMALILMAAATAVSHVPAFAQQAPVAQEHQFDSQRRHTVSLRESAATERTTPAMNDSPLQTPLPAADMAPPAPDNGLQQHAMLLGTLFGLAIGIVLGLTGAGGGILAVPALVLGLGWSLPQATPVALLAVGLAAALGAVDGLRKGLVRWRAALLMATLGVLFSPLGVHAAHVLPQKALMTMFAIAMLAASTRLLLQGRASTDNAVGLPALDKNCMLSSKTGRLNWTRRCAVTLAGIGSVSGLLTGMLGVGGGFLIVPAFRQWTDLRMHGIVATSLLVVALVSIGATASALGAGAQVTRVGAIFIGAAMAGMIGGRVVAPHLPGQRLQFGFALLSAGVALFLLERTWA